MATGMRMTKNGVDAWAKQMLSKENQAGAYLNRVIYPFIFKGSNSVQAKRWMSEGSSETVPWAPLTIPYQDRKMRLFYNTPHRGMKKLVATERLLGANTGQPKEPGDHKKVVSGKTLTVTIGIPYAKFVNRARNFIQFGPSTRADLKRMISDYFKSKSK